jgi:hypothetical protein
MSYAYDRHRTIYEDISGTLTVLTTTGDTTLVTAKANHTIYVQRIYMVITTDAAQSISFEDSAGTPILLGGISASPGANSRHELDFGPEGRPLTEGKNLVMNVSAAGLAGSLVWEGYQKLTGVAAPA